MIGRVTMQSATRANPGQLSTGIGHADRHLWSALCADHMDATLPGERPGSSPQPPEAGARRARLYGVASVADNRN